MAANLEQIKELLGLGIAAEQVAEASGVSPSYISQLLSDDVFAQEVAERRVKSLQANTLRDKRLDGIEDKLIEELEATVEAGLIYKPRDVLAALTQVNRMQRRGAPVTPGSQTRQTVVNLNIPTHLTQNFVLSANKEVIEVEGQTMVTMPAHQLLKRLQSEAAQQKPQPGDTTHVSTSSEEAAIQRAETYERIGRFLPAAGVVDA